MTLPARLLFAALVPLLPAAMDSAAAQPGFTTGPLVEGFGGIAEVPGHLEVPRGTSFKVAFDVARAAEPGSVSRALDTPARFLNMHAAAGVEPADMKLAIVIHGKAVYDVVRNTRYRDAHGTDNGSSALVAALVEQGVVIEVCGQSAVYYGVAPDDLLPGVRMSLSAMTSHALLQQDGYTLNPF